MAAFLASREISCTIKLVAHSSPFRMRQQVCRLRKQLVVLSVVPQRSFFISTSTLTEGKDVSTRLKVAPEEPLPAEELPMREKFIPITRRSVIRHLMQEDHFLTEHELKKFETFSTALDSAIVNRYYGMLQDIKTLFDPLNPDKETISTRQWNRRERLDNEFWLLQKLGGIMEKANFYEIPKTTVTKALAEHSSAEGLIVSVNTDKYDILKFWALGRELSEEKPTLFQTLKNYAMFRPPLKPIEFYKRVVVAVRLKKDDKLLLKAFKEVPVNSLEMLLPDGKIRMSTLDQRIVLGTVGIGGIMLGIKAITMQMNIQAPWLLVLAGLTGIIAVRAWNVYKNRRNMYVVELSRMLYFKNIANNRGLLTLLVDRAEDETFKEALLAYSFLLTCRPPSAQTKGSSDLLPAEIGVMSAGQLESKIEYWIFTKTGTKVEFDSDESVRILTDFGLLSQGEDDQLHVLPLEAAMRNLPQQPKSISARSDEYDIVEGYDKDITDESEADYKREAKKRKKFGWS